MDPYATLTAYQNSAVLMAAAECKLFDALGDMPAPASAIAAKARMPLNSARRLLRTLAACQFIGRSEESEDPHYAHNDFSRVFTKTGAGGLARVVHKEALFYRVWGQLSTALRSQKALLPSYAERVEKDPAQVRLFLTALNDLAALAFGGIRPHLPWAEDEAVTLLDAGGGAAGYTSLLTEAFPQLSVTLLDWPEILPLAEETLNAVGRLDRVDLVTGDLRVPGLGHGAGFTFDHVWLSHILHDYTPEMAAEIVQQVAGAVAPGGTLQILDVFEPAPGEAENPVEALFDLMMLVENPGGLTHAKTSVLKWVEAAGLEVTAAHKLYFGTLIQAKKPA